MLAISSRFAAQCSPVIGVQNETCGSVTRASIAHLTPEQLNSIFTPGGLFADLDAWFLHQIEMRACGMRRYVWYDWIYANADRTMFRSAISGTKGVKVASLLHPFVFGRQESVVNRDYWKVINGVATGGYTPNTPATAVGTISAGPLLAAQLVGATRVIRVQSRHGIPMDPNWFRVKEVIHLFGKQAGTGISQQGNWRVTGAAVNTALTYIDVALADENAGSTQPFDATPIAGLIIVGINNVNDFEFWCQNLPNVDPRKRVPFWFQTFRNSRCVDEEYTRVFNKLFETNPAFREFGDLPMAERNRQDELEAQKRFVNAFMFQKAISANQTLPNWESLTAIDTILPYTGTWPPPVGATPLNPGMGGKIIGRRANFIGAKEQLRACNRWKDLQGNTLMLSEFLDHAYFMVRHIKSSGRKVTSLDFWTNSIFRAHFQTAAFQYYKDMYLDMLHFNQNINQLNGELGLTYDKYFFKRPTGIAINIIEDEFFDDYYDEMNAYGMGDLGNLLVSLDIGKPPNGSIYWAQIAANRKSYTTAGINELARIDGTYRCVMDQLQLTQNLTSETGTVIVECPEWSLGIENFRMAPPNTVISSGPDYTNLY